MSRSHPDLSTRIGSVRRRIAERKRARRATADLERDHVQLVVKQIRAEMKAERKAAL